MKKILLVGKNGQLGSEIINGAEVFDLKVFGFDREELDVTDAGQILEKIDKIKPDVIINASAYNLVLECEENYADAIEINFLAVQNLARACKENGVIFVTYSTDYVFNGRKGAPYLENDVPGPLQMYGISKLAGEYAALGAYPEKTFVIRTCGLYGGEKGSPEKGNFVLNILKEAKEKEIIEVSSEQVVGPTYAKDLSQATLKLLNSKAMPGVYHLVNEGCCSWHEFAQEIFKLAGINKAIRAVDRQGASGKMKRPVFSALKNTKAKALGIELPSWQEGLKSYFNFLEKNENRA